MSPCRFNLSQDDRHPVEGPRSRSLSTKGVDALEDIPRGSRSESEPQPRCFLGVSFLEGIPVWSKRAATRNAAILGLGGSPENMTHPLSRAARRLTKNVRPALRQLAPERAALRKARPAFRKRGENARPAHGPFLVRVLAHMAM